jgi:hypothetical protein
MTISHDRADAEQVEQLCQGRVGHHRQCYTIDMALASAYERQAHLRASVRQTPEQGLV